MLTITTAAKRYLAALRERANLVDGERTLRLVTAPTGQLGLLPDVPRRGDHHVEHEGATILVVGPQAAAPLARAIIDATPEPAEGLVVKRLPKRR